MSNGVGMPAHILLHTWGGLVRDAFGELPFLVGSATTSKTWRDVDVRLMLDDEQWSRILPDVPQDQAHHLSPQWAALCMAVSAWGRDFTGLPIDFQFQPRDVANEKFAGPREPLGVRVSYREP